MRKDIVNMQRIGKNFEYPYLFVDCDGEPLNVGDTVTYNGGEYVLTFSFDYKGCGPYYCLRPVGIRYAFYFVQIIIKVKK